MIQRIQTVYLLLAALAVGLLFFVPVGYLKIPVLENISANGAVTVLSKSYLAVITGSIALVILIAIFRFSNRKTQVLLSGLSIVFNASLSIFLFNELRSYEPAPTVISVVEYGAGIALPFISMVFLLLAILAIRKDDKLVKSADRLR